MGDQLPEDLTAKILSRLPVKSLVRFRCVCKSWNELIRSPNFISIHLKADDQNKRRRGTITGHIDGGTFFSVRVNEMTTDLSLPVPDVERAVDIVGSLDGLVCLDFVDHPQDYALWNPAIREFRVIPEPKTKFDDRNFSEGSGFVFDPKSKDYKVVRITVENDKLGSYIAQVNVFTLSSNSWKSIQLNLPSEISEIYSSRPIFINGCSYWVVVLPGEERNRRYALLCYDIGEENFRELTQVPCDLNGLGICLQVYGDSLVMIGCNYNFDGPIERTWFDAWVMNEHGDGGEHYSWRKQLSVGPLEMGVVSVPYGLLMKDGVELVLLDIYGADARYLQQFTFHPVTQQFKKFQGDCPRQGCDFQHNCCNYYESLVWL